VSAARYPALRTRLIELLALSPLSVENEKVWSEAALYLAFFFFLGFAMAFNKQDLLTEHERRTVDHLAADFAGFKTKRLCIFWPLNPQRCTNDDPGSVQ